MCVMSFMYYNVSFCTSLWPAVFFSKCFKNNWIKLNWIGEYILVNTVSFRKAMQRRQEIIWGDTRHIRRKEGRMRQDLNFSLFHGSEEPLGFLIEGHPHPMKPGHLLCNFC